MLATELLQIPPKYKEFTKVFSKKKLNELPTYGADDHSIKLEGFGDPPFRPLYNLSGNEVKVL